MMVAVTIESAAFSQTPRQTNAARGAMPGDARSNQRGVSVAEPASMSALVAGGRPVTYALGSLKLRPPATNQATAVATRTIAAAIQAVVNLTAGVPALTSPRPTTIGQTKFRPRIA